MGLPLGTKVDVFERDGYETVEGTVWGYEGKYILVRYKNENSDGWETLKIPSPKVEVRITIRGNSLEQYKQ